MACISKRHYDKFDRMLKAVVVSCLLDRLSSLWPSMAPPAAAALGLVSLVLYDRFIVCLSPPRPLRRCRAGDWLALGDGSPELRPESRLVLAAKEKDPFFF